MNTSPRIKQIVIIISILAIVIIALAIYFKPTMNLPKPIKIDTTDQPTLGNENAKIHIVAFEDLKCGNCMRYNTQILPTIKKDYIDTGKAKYTVINLAFIPGSMPAANAARCVYSQNKTLFFPYVKYIYNHQPPENQNWATVPTLLEFATHVEGINENTLAQCILKSPYTDFIHQNLKLAMKIMGSQVVTPTVYVNGRIVKPLSLARIESLIKASQ